MKYINDFSFSFLVKINSRKRRILSIRTKWYQIAETSWPFELLLTYSKNHGWQKTVTKKQNNEDSSSHFICYHIFLLPKSYNVKHTCHWKYLFYNKLSIIFTGEWVSECVYIYIYIYKISNEIRQFEKRKVILKIKLPFHFKDCFLRNNHYKTHQFNFFVLSSFSRMCVWERETY